jgi:hypothetical protein
LDQHVVGKESKVRFFFGIDAPNLNYLIFLTKGVNENGVPGYGVHKTEVIYHLHIF